MESSNPALETLILEDPSRMDTWLVYADWLMEKGEPRGRLIAAFARGEPTHGHLLRHLDRFLGPFAGGRELARWVDLTWQPGFWEKAHVEVGSRRPGRRGMPPMAHVLKTLLTHPSARLLRSLSIGCPEDRWSWQAAVDALIEAGRGLPLRSLRIGHFDTRAPLPRAEDNAQEMMDHGAFIPLDRLLAAQLIVGWAGEAGEDPRLAWWPRGPDLEADLDVHRLWSAFPSLAHLEIEGLRVRLGRIESPRLESLILRSSGLLLEPVQAIGRARLPSLEALELWFGASECGPHDLASLLYGQGLPGLRWLGLVGTSFTDELPGMLVRSPLLRGLRGLDLSRGRLTADGIRELLAHADHFSHLEELDVGVSESGERWWNGALEEALPDVRPFIRPRAPDAG